MLYLIVLALSGAATIVAAFGLPLALIAVLASWEDPESQDRRVLAAVAGLFALSLTTTIYLATAF